MTSEPSDTAADDDASAEAETQQVAAVTTDDEQPVAPRRGRGQIILLTASIVTALLVAFTAGVVVGAATNDDDGPRELRRWSATAERGGPRMDRFGRRGIPPRHGWDQRGERGRWERPGTDRTPADDATDDEKDDATAPSKRSSNDA